MRPRLLSCLAPLAALMGGPACTEYALTPDKSATDPGEVDIDVRPQHLDFLGAGAGETVVRTFTITNVGRARADLDPLLLEAADSFSLVAGQVPDVLEPDEFVEVEVAFSPQAAGQRDARVLVRSNDSDEPELPVELTGWGLVPQLSVRPPEHEFGEVAVGCDDSVVVTLENIGEAELEVTAVDFSADLALALDRPVSTPLLLAPGGRAEAVVRFAPSTLGPAAAALTVSSNDPAGDRVALQAGEGEGGDPRTDRARFDADVPVDLLFAIDQSCSMDDEAALVAEQFGPLVQAIGAVTTGWQVGVVTLDSGCVNDGLFDASTGDLEARFTEAALLGEDRDILDDEALLKLSHRALLQTADGDCNAGLLRPGASTHLVVVSDEPERSVQQAASWTWDYWLAALEDAAPESTGLQVSGIVDTDGCSDGDAGYAEAIAATGGVSLSICAGDWSSYGSTLAEATLARAWVVPLTAEPLEATLAVTVGGAAWSAWTYDAADNAVALTENPGTAEVVVSYEVPPDCAR